MCDMRQQDKAEYRRLLDEIGSDYCKGNPYCLFKEFLVSTHPSRRLLVQLKCCDKYKFQESEKEGKDIGWDQTIARWMSNGYATKFSRMYDDKKSSSEIFRLVMSAD